MACGPDCGNDRLARRADAPAGFAERMDAQRWPFEGASLCWVCWRTALGISTAYDFAARFFGLERRIPFDTGERCA